MRCVTSEIYGHGLTLAWVTAIRVAGWQTWQACRPGVAGLGVTVQGREQGFMRVPKEVLAKVDFEATCAAELSARNRYLPPPLADRALLANSAALADRLETLMRREHSPSAQDSVLARKAGRGSRPLPYVSLEDRLVYRALVSTLTARLPEVPGRRDYDTFSQSPLSSEDCRYVLKADVAAFYQYIDHERLIDEVVAQTGDDLAITASVELLQAGTGRRFGLPQMNAASDVLADVYIDPIRRSLLRSGLAVTRFADDFRVACRDYSEALSALEQIERAAFDLGLVLNEAKSSTPARSTYEESLYEVSRAEEQLFADLTEEGVTVDDFFALDAQYEDQAADDSHAGQDVTALPGAGHDEADPADEADGLDAPTPEQLEVASRVVSMWASTEPDPHQWSSGVWSALLRKSLFALEAGRDPRAVPSAISLLVHQPQLTPQVCGYLAAAGEERPDLVHGVLDVLSENDIVGVWQALWVTYLAGSVPGGSRQADHVQWLRRQADSRHGAVSAQATLALARRRLLSVSAAASAYERSAQPHRPTAALALAAARGVAGADVVHDNQVEGWLGGWVRTQPWGTPPAAKPGIKLIRRKRP